MTATDTELLVEALRPFAALGDVFLPADEGDESAFTKIPDYILLSIGCAGNAISVSVGDLRRASLAFAKAGGGR